MAAGVVGEDDGVQFFQVVEDVLDGAAAEVGVDRLVQAGHAVGVVVVGEDLLDGQPLTRNGWVRMPLRLIDMM